MATAEEILAELERRGLDTSKLRAATPITASPAGAKPTPANYPAGMLDALKHQNTLEPETTETVAKEFGSGLARTATGFQDGDPTMMGNAYILAKAMGSLYGGGSGSEAGKEAYEMTKGGQMKPGLARDFVAKAGEYAPAVVGFTGPLKGALSRGAARVAPKAATRSSSSLGAAIKPAGQATSKAAKKAPGRLKRAFSKGKKWTGETGVGATEGAVVGGLVDKDPVEGALWGMAFGNPLGRWGMSRIAGKALGDKARVMTYLGAHPATRHQVKRLARALGVANMTDEE